MADQQPNDTPVMKVKETDIQNVPEERVSISVAMVVKNEEESLQLCFLSFADIVDEIIVLVDDTSTDRTFEIAQQFSSNVQHFHWENDFSKARNQAIELCTKDYVLIMDGHEILHPSSRGVLIDILRRLSTGGDLVGTDIFSAYIYMNPESTSDVSKMIPEVCFLQPRLFRNIPELRYRGRVHNWLDPEKAPGIKRPVFELVIVHQRASENAKARVEQRKIMNVEMLKLDIAEEPENARPYFYLAQTYMEIKEYKQALIWYKKYLKLSKWDAEKAQAALQMAAIYANEYKDIPKAVGILKQAIAWDWERAELYIMLGDVAFSDEKWYEAEHWYMMAKDMRHPMSGMFLHGPAYSYLPYSKLAGVYSQVQEWFEAIKNAEKSFELGCPNEELKTKLTAWYEILKVSRDRKNVIMYDHTMRYTFVKELRQRLMDTYNVAWGVSWDGKGVYDPDFSRWANVIWMEWLSEDAVKMTKYPKPKNQVWICRLHGYELYRPERLDKMDFSQIDCLVFVAEHIRQKFMNIYGAGLPPNLRTEVIYNGIETNNFAFSKREHSTKKNIGVIGVFTNKKGTERLAMTIRHFQKHHPDYKFLLRFDVPNVASMEWFSFQHDILDCDNWEIVPRVESMDAWMEDLKFVLSTSNIESFSYVVAEGMAKGIKPLVYNWFGAKDLWPEEVIWNDFEELDALIHGSYDSAMYRAWVAERYHIDIQTEKTVALFEELMIQKGESQPELGATPAVLGGTRHAE